MASTSGKIQEEDGDVAGKKRGRDEEFDDEELGSEEFDAADLDDELDLDDDDLDGEDLADDEFADDELDGDEAPAGRGRTRTAAATARKPVRVKAPSAPGSGVLSRLGKYVREIAAELQKVIWPTRKELLTYTTVVVVFVAIMMTFVGLLDFGFVKLMVLAFGGGDTSAATTTQ